MYWLPDAVLCLILKTAATDPLVGLHLLAVEKLVRVSVLWRCLSAEVCRSVQRVVLCGNQIRALPPLARNKAVAGRVLVLLAWCERRKKLLLRGMELTRAFVAALRWALWHKPVAQLFLESCTVASSDVLYLLKCGGALTVANVDVPGGTPQFRLERVDTFHLIETRGDVVAATGVARAFCVHHMFNVRRVTFDAPTIGPVKVAGFTILRELRSLVIKNAVLSAQAQDEIGWLLDSAGAEVLTLHKVGLQKTGKRRDLLAARKLCQHLEGKVTVVDRRLCFPT